MRSIAALPVRWIGLRRAFLGLPTQNEANHYQRESRESEILAERPKESFQ
jgi:hypothetical protein